MICIEKMQLCFVNISKLGCQLRNINNNWHVVDFNWLLNKTQIKNFFKFIAFLNWANINETLPKNRLVSGPFNLLAKFQKY